MQDYNVPRWGIFFFFSPAGGKILHFVPRWRGCRGWKSVAWVFRTAKNASHKLKVGRTTDVIFSPPPSLRDTSASGGQKIVVSPVPLQDCNAAGAGQFMFPSCGRRLFCFSAAFLFLTGGNILFFPRLAFIPRRRKNSSFCPPLAGVQGVEERGVGFSNRQKCGS
jgi:hypothetical protein